MSGIAIVGVVFFCANFAIMKRGVIEIAPTDIQRRHRQEYRQEREAVVDDALRSSHHGLTSAGRYFDSVVRDRGLRDEFVQSLDRAHEILADLGVDPTDD